MIRNRVNVFRECKDGIHRECHRTFDGPTARGEPVVFWCACECHGEIPPMGVTDYPPLRLHDHRYLLPEGQP